MTITGEIETSGAGLEAGLPETSSGGIVRAAAVSTRHKRGKQMSRRKGQNPKLEVRNGMYTFRYRKDVPGVEDRKQVRGVIGSIKQMTKSEAERRIKEFMVEQQINTGAAKIPSVLTFADTVKHYRDVFAPRMLRASTFQSRTDTSRDTSKPIGTKFPWSTSTLTQ